MRVVFLTIANLLRLLLALPGLPGRLLRRKHRPAYVRFRLTGEPSYRKTPRRGLPFFRPAPEPATVGSLEGLREALDELVKDPAVRGVLFEVESLGISSAKRQAVAELFKLARAAGKEVIAHAVTASTSEYALLCEADRIWMSPAGSVELVGYAAEATVIGAGLKRLGVVPHFIRRGDYKTAPELFTRETISEIQRETIETLLDERYGELVSAIARGRKISEEEARKKIDEGPYSARRALAAGLVDALVSEATLPERLAKELGQAGKAPAPEPAVDAKEQPPSEEEEDDDGGDASGQLGNFDDYAATLALPPSRRWRRARRPPRLALVTVSGIIGQGQDGLSPLGRIAGSENILRALRAAARDRRSKAILLYIDSPGGSAVASEIVLEQVQRAARRKPVLAYFDQVAASGGYMAALGGREIWAAPQAVAGSIGVFAGKFDVSGLMERLGIHRLLITRGENAGLQSVSRGFTPHERASLEADIEDTYQAFLEHVAKARRMSKEEAHRRAEGRIFSGAVALKEGLVDGTCGFEQACRRALELADVKEPDFQIKGFSSLPRRFPLPSGLFQLASARVYTLWWPWLKLPGMEGSR